VKRRRARSRWLAVACGASLAAGSATQPAGATGAWELLAPDRTHRAAVDDAARSGADCARGAFRLEFVIARATSAAVGVEGDAVAYAVATDGQAFALRARRDGTATLVTASGEVTAVTLQAETPAEGQAGGLADGRLAAPRARLRGAYRLRGLRCEAAVDAALREDGSAPGAAALADAHGALGRLAKVTALRDQGDYAKALDEAIAAQRALAAALGAEHPGALAVEAKQPFLMMYGGRTDAAAQLARSVIARAGAVLGAWHPDTRGVRADLLAVLVVGGRYAEAIAEGHAAADQFAAELGDEHPETLRVRGRLGVAYRFGGNPQAAREILEKTVAAQVRVLGPDATEISTTRGVLAQSYGDLGMVSEQLRLEREAQAVAERRLPPDHPFVLIGKVNVATALQRAGEYAAALREAEEAYDRQVGRLGAEHREVAYTLTLRGELHEMLGDPTAALAALDAAIAVSRRTLGDRHPETIDRQNSRAGVLGTLGRHREAYEEQLRIHELAREAMGEQDPMTWVYLGNAGWAARLARDHDTARALLLRARAAFERIGDSARLRLLENSRHLAELHADTGQLDLAEDAYAELTQAYAAHYSESHPKTLAARLAWAQVRMRRGDRRGAQSLFEAVVERYETLRRDSGLTVEQMSALSLPLVDAYRSLAWLYALSGRDAEAFAAAERGRARRLLDELTKRRADEAGILTPDEQQQLLALERRMAWLADAAGAAFGQPGRRLELESQRNGVQRELAQLRQRLRERYPRYAQLAGVAIVPADVFARSLAADEAFVSYTVAGDRLLAQTVTRRGVRTVDLGTWAPLMPQVARLRELLLSAAPAHVLRPVTDALHAALLRPLDDLARARRWIVSPDADLALLPFEVLAWRDGTALRVDVRYAQSASVHALLVERQGRYRRQPPPLDVLAVGAPNYALASAPGAPAASGDGVARAAMAAHVAPDLLERTAQQPGGISRALDRLAITWQNLPGAGDEARDVAALFKRSRLLLGADASEPALQRIDRSGELARYRYLLFATHGYLNLEVPLLSAVVLSQVPRGGDADGYVTAAEWPGYRLRSDLTVLSGCETALGAQVRGEGVMGLPFALFVAGNVNTVMTLWPVADRSTALFMKQFFARVSKGQPHADALAQTKRWMSRHPRYAHARFWAPFVLYGV
jgi:tetratricopeptide (TPR) repeat protein